MARLPISVETRRQLDDHDCRWPIKLGLRAITIPFAIIAMILFAVSTSLTRLNYGGNDWTDGLPLAPVSWMLPRLCRKLQHFPLCAPLETRMEMQHIHHRCFDLHSAAYMTLVSAGPPRPLLRLPRPLPHSIPASRPPHPPWMECRSRSPHLGPCCTIYRLFCR